MSKFAKRHALVLFLYFTSIIILLTYFMDPAMSIGTLVLLSLCGRRYAKHTWGLCLGMMLFATLLNGLFNHRGVTTLFYLGSWRITAEACLYGLLMAVYLGAVYFTFAWMNRMMTGDKWMSLFGQVSVKLALLFSMSLGIVPKLQKDYKMIQQSSRGMGEKKHSIQVVGTLVGNSLEDSIDRSDSMKARGYYCDKRKTSLLPQINKWDWIWIGAIMIVVIGCFVSGVQEKIRPEFFPEIQVWHKAIPVKTYFLYGILLMMPWALQWKEEIVWKRYLRSIN